MPSVNLEAFSFAVWFSLGDLSSWLVSLVGDDKTNHIVDPLVQLVHQTQEKRKHTHTQPYTHKHTHAHTHTHVHTHTHMYTEIYPTSTKEFPQSITPLAVWGLSWPDPVQRLSILACLPACLPVLIPWCCLLADHRAQAMEYL